jgi:recombination DNA repair RAD52 pathway protein
MFTEAQIKLLQQPLDPAHVKTRKGPNGMTLSYVEGWQVLEECNLVFGFGNWSCETVMIEPLHDPVLITDHDSPEKGKVVSAYTAKVRITVYSQDGTRSIVREGCGAARGFAKTAGEAMEQAIKSAETDACKRALVGFGARFGAALRDREQRNVGKPENRQAAGPSDRTVPAIDEGFDPPQPQIQRPTISQRALGVTKRPAFPNGHGGNGSVPY